MSGIFHEPLETAVYGRRRGFAPPAIRRAFSRARTVQALDVFSDEAWTVQRRAFAPPRVMPLPAATAPFSRATHVLASLLGAGVYDDAPHTPARRQPAPVATRPGDNGLSASFTVTFTGKGDDPYGAVGMAADTGVALGVDTSRELAVQNPSVFGGASASRAV